MKRPSTLTTDPILAGFRRRLAAAWWAAAMFCLTPVAVARGEGFEPTRLFAAAEVGTASSGSSANGDETTLLLANGRFAVRVAWNSPAGASGVGQGVALTADSGYFWFFAASNVELVVKVLDACSFAGASRFWFFAAGLTDVGTTITVTDQFAGIEKVYQNPTGQAFQPINDTAAFDTCSVLPPLPVASFSTDATCPEAGVCDVAVGQEITFTDTSTGSVASRLWELGDGATATTQTTVHTYGLAGSYLCELTVTNAAGSSTASATFTVGTGPPTVDTLLAEDFSAVGVPAGWTSPVSSRWSVLDGELQSTGTPHGSSRGPLSYGPGFAWTNYAVSADLRSTNWYHCCSAFNLYGRFTNVDNHILLQMHSNGRASLVRVVDGIGFILRSKTIGSAAITEPARYRLEFRDNQITAFRNGEQMFVANDDGSLVGGTIGFESFDINLRVDNVEVNAL